MTLTRTAPVALAATLLLTGCAPGWDGKATVVELELEDYDITRGDPPQVDAERVEVSVVTPSGTETVLAMDPDCTHALRLNLGDTLTWDQAQKCGAR